MTLQDDLLAACRALAEAGLSPGSSGNISVRDDERIYITRSGASLRRIEAEDLAVVSLGGEHLSGPRPTKELGMHLVAYRERPDDRAVAHLHSHAATAVSCLSSDGGDPLPPYTPYRVRMLGAVDTVAYAPPGSAELTDGVAARVAQSPVLLLANHGSLVCASDVWRAVDLSEELEAAAALTLTLAGRAARTLDPERAWRSAGS